MNIDDISALTTEEYRKLLQSMQEQAEKQPETASSLLSDFYRLLENKRTNSDMLYVSALTFAEISKGLSKSQIAEALETMRQRGRDEFILLGGSVFCSNNPVCAVPVFDYMVKRIEQTPNFIDDKNFSLPLVRDLTSVLSSAEDVEIPAMLKKLDRINSNNPKIQDLFVPSYIKLYEEKPAAREFILDKLLTECSHISDLSRLYLTLEKIISIDKEKASECLRIINSVITDPKHDIMALRMGYNVLGQIRKIYPNKEEVDAIFMRGLQNPQNTVNSERYAYRQMENYDKLVSHSYLGQRVEKTNENQYGFRRVDSIDSDETAVLFLGGNGTDSDKSANGYLSSVEELLSLRNIKEKVSLYAAIYDFGLDTDCDIMFDDVLARRKLMQDHHRSVKLDKKLNKDTLNPRYINDLFDKTLLRRISDENSKRLSTEEACAKIRKLTVVAHCHGAYTFLKLEEKMQKKMRELGYSDEERAKIQHELLCIAHAPYAPIGVSKSTMISFVSAQDTGINHCNNFDVEIRNMLKNNEVQLSYFPDKQGEMFLTPSMGHIDQHDFFGYNPATRGFSKEGQAILSLAGNAIVNGIKNSVSGKSLPSVKDIVCGQDEKFRQFFDVLKENGAKMWQKMSLNTALRLKAKHNKEK